jgi:hypothetical protein
LDAAWCLATTPTHLSIHIDTIWTRMPVRAGLRRRVVRRGAHERISAG